MEHFKQERIQYLDYYNNHRIQAKRKGLPPAFHRQQALLAAPTFFVSKYCLIFGGTSHSVRLPFFLFYWISIFLTSGLTSGAFGSSSVSTPLS